MESNSEMCRDGENSSYCSGTFGTLEELEGKSEADLRRLGALALAEDAKKQAEANEGAPQQSEEEQLQAELDRLLVELQMAERPMPQACTDLIASYTSL